MENTDFDIELQAESEDQAGSVQLPLNFLTFGEIENDDVKVYIKQSTYKALEKLASSDTSKELGSILLGEYSEEMGKTHVIISDYIEAKYTDASASTLTFTHETWDYVHKEREEKHPDKKIIGWQHTHPNYGIFLSNYDMFIQENFFNMPFQIAYVIDPIQNLRGFFQWKNGKIEKLKGYYIYDDIGKPIKIEQTKTEKKNDAPGAKPGKGFHAAIAVLSIAVILLSIFAVSLGNKYNEQLKKQQTILDEISNQQTVIDDQSEVISQLQEQIINGILDGSGKTTAADLIAMLENNEITIQNQEEVIAELKAFVNKNNKKSKKVEFISYTVVQGDTLSEICKKNKLDYHSCENIILSINGIENPNRIYVGQNLLLPCY